MPSELVLRPAEPRDSSAVLALVRMSLGGGSVPRSEAFWRWKHEENPFGPSPILVAESGGRIIGVRAFLRWSFSGRGGAWPAARAVDTVTHPDHRGRGVFRALTMEMLRSLQVEGVRLVFNTPNSQSRPGYLKMGWKSLGPLRLWARPLRPVRIVRGWLARRQATEPVTSRPLPVSVDDSPGTRRHAEWSSVEEAASGAAVSTERLSTSRPVAYMSWRYGRVPGLEYGAEVDHGGGPPSAAVYRLVERDGLRELRICELIAGTRTGGETCLAAVIQEVGARSDADVISALPGPSERAATILRRSGFIPLPRMGPILTVRAIAPCGPEEAVGRPGRTDISTMRRGSFAFSLGDLELF